MAITPVTQGQLHYLRADGIAVPHCFTTRLGGVSQGALASLNIGQRCGDDPKNVEQNLAILGAAVGFSPDALVAGRQIHSDIVRRVDSRDTGRFFLPDASPQCDGLITCTPGVALAVFTADCTPILLHDPVTGAVGAVHAGWRGTAMDIGGKAVQAMVREFGCDPKNIRAAIGPNIGPCCFETNADVPDALAETYGAAAQKWVEARNGKYYVNLKAINALSLARAGVETIEISPLCTACRQDLFWSHRKVGLNRGSQGAIIVCKEVSE